jgi:hypothetical protein
MQIRHQYRSRHALSGHVAQDEVEMVAVLEKVYVVAAYDTRRLVRKVDVPINGRESRPRQQPLLYLGGKLQIALHIVELLLSEISETKPDKRIRDESFGLDRIVTLFAQTVCTVLESRQRRIDFTQKAGNIQVEGAPRLRLPQFRTSIEKLAVQHRIERSIQNWLSNLCGVHTTDPPA